MPIYLIRHGQSEFNAAHKEGEPDPMIFDAPLTPEGQLQAQQARLAASELGIGQVITSPLTRAIQTAIVLFEGIAPIRVVADHRELLSHSCDVGRPKSVLKQDFPGLSFDHLDEIWWHQGAENEDGVPVEPHDAFKQRIRRFAVDLVHIKERPLAVVGHGDTFRELAGFSMANCEIRKYPE
jgi:broad specificity phosphatase PhoE